MDEPRCTGGLRGIRLAAGLRAGDSAAVLGASLPALLVTGSIVWAESLLALLVALALLVLEWLLGRCWIRPAGPEVMA